MPNDKLVSRSDLSLSLSVETRVVGNLTYRVESKTNDLIHVKETKDDMKNDGKNDMKYDKDNIEKNLTIPICKPFFIQNDNYRIKKESKLQKNGNSKPFISSGSYRKNNNNNSGINSSGSSSKQGEIKIPLKLFFFMVISFVTIKMFPYYISSSFID